MIDRLNALFNVSQMSEVWGGEKDLKTTTLAESTLRYRTWYKEFKRRASPTAEYLLPSIVVNYQDQLPASMQKAEGAAAADPGTAERLARLRWGYYYYLGNGLSTADATPDHRAHQRGLSLLRFQMINDILEKLIEGDRSQISVLDFACNWGGFSVDLALRGFGRVTAFDARQENIDRAKQLASFLGVSPSFSVADVYALPPDLARKYDVVLNLGLLYHVTDPVRLVQLTYELTETVAVFDSAVHLEPFSGFIQAYTEDRHLDRPGMGTQRVELHPTYRAMIDLIRFAGFRELVEVVPVVPPAATWRDRDYYHLGLRRTIFAFK